MASYSAAPAMRILGQMLGLPTSSITSDKNAKGFIFVLTFIKIQYKERLTVEKINKSDK